MPVELTESDIFVLLSDRRRRLLLQLLRESTTTMTVKDLAERIAEQEYESPTERQRRSVHLGLHHNHLIRLERADVIDYDQSDGTVTPALNFDRLLGYLEAATDWNQSQPDE